MGFLDKNTRVIDMVLTDYGRELYSKGELEFTYYALSDDEVDYDPFISNSGSLNADQLKETKTEQIEATLVREALFGMPKGTDQLAKDETNIQKLLFTMPQGATIVPEMRISPDIASGSINVKQQKIKERSIVRDQFGNVIQRLGEFDRGYRKFGATRHQFAVEIDDFFNDGARDGFLIRVFQSGSTGLTEQFPKRDLKNILSYGCDIQVYRDIEIDRVSDQRVDNLLKQEKRFSLARKK